MIIILENRTIQHIIKDASTTNKKLRRVEFIQTKLFNEQIRLKWHSL